MVDKMTAQQRHKCMSRIRAKNTRPEMIVRRHLWSQGYRYRLHRKDLPGKPDIVIGRLKVAVFINGCFWHGHSCQKHFPETNAEFWREKIYRNRDRDYKNHSELEGRGWLVIVMWECELSRKDRREAALERLMETLRLLEMPAVKPYKSPAIEEPYAAAAEGTDYPTYGDSDDTY